MSQWQVGTLDTVTAYISDARTLLQDTIAPQRYSDADLVLALNTTVLEARRIRADLFVWQHGHDKVPSYNANDTEEVKIEPQFRLAFVYGIVGNALLRDQEDIEDTRAANFLSAFNSMLLGTGAAAIITPPGHGTVPQGGQR